VTDTERLDYLSSIEGDLFTPKVNNAGVWSWYGNDGRSATAPTLRELLDALPSVPEPSPF
jgi:hypothetical protein